MELGHQDLPPPHEPRPCFYSLRHQRFAEHQQAASALQEAREANDILQYLKGHPV